MSETKHTSGPLTTIYGQDYCLFGADGFPVASTKGKADIRRSPEEADANAERIRLAWNCHDDLLAVCKEMQCVLTEPGIMDVDEWKAWKRDVEERACNLFAKAESKSVPQSAGVKP